MLNPHIDELSVFFKAQRQFSLSVMLLENKKENQKNGLNRELNPGPPPNSGVPEEGIILLDH